MTELGSYYEGNMFNGNRNGFGTMTHTNKLKQFKQYSGNWVDNKINGNGIMIYFSGNIYEGTFKDGMRDGYGKYTNVIDEYDFEGYWKDDIMTDFGTFKYYNGNIYNGYVHDGLHHGKGKMEYINDKIYDGEWFYGNKHGYGKLTYFNCVSPLNIKSYEGTWNNDKKSNVFTVTFDDNSFYKGDIEYMKNSAYPISKDNPPTIVYSNGDIYVGELLEMKRYGKGILETASGCVYRGNWCNDMFDGEGMFIDINKNIFTCEWLNGKKHGKGNVKFANGLIYNGLWLNDNYYKEGELISTKNTYKCTHEDDNTIKLYLDNKIVYSGEHLNFQRHGHGKELELDGTLFEGKWNYDNRVEGIIVLPNKTNKYMCYYNNNKTIIPIKMINVSNNEINLFKEYDKIKRKRDELHEDLDTCINETEKKLRYTTKLFNKMVNELETKTIKLQKIEKFINDIPYILKCPITMDIMSEPVVCNDGHTYEKSAILKYIQTKKAPVSPINRIRLSKDLIIPNHTVKKMIESWKSLKDTGSVVPIKNNIVREKMSIPLLAPIETENEYNKLELEMQLELELGLYQIACYQ